MRATVVSPHHDVCFSSCARLIAYAINDGLTTASSEETETHRCHETKHQGHWVYFSSNIKWVGCATRLQIQQMRVQGITDVASVGVWMAFLAYFSDTREKPTFNTSLFATTYKASASTSERVTHVPICKGGFTAQTGSAKVRQPSHTMWWSRINYKQGPDGAKDF